MARKNDDLFQRATHEGAKIGYMIDSIQKRGTEIVQNIHICACSCVLHAVKHGDIMYAQRLVDALDRGTGKGGGWDLNALRAWFGKYGPYGWAAKTKERAAHFTLNKEKREPMLKALEANEQEFTDKLAEIPYWVFKPQKEFEGFDLTKAIHALVGKAKRIAADENKAKHKDTKIDSRLLARLEALGEGGKFESTDMPPAGSAPVSSEGSPALAETVH